MKVPLAENWRPGGTDVRLPVDGERQRREKARSRRDMEHRTKAVTLNRLPNGNHGPGVSGGRVRLQLWRNERNLSSDYGIATRCATESVPAAPPADCRNAASSCTTFTTHRCSCHHHAHRRSVQACRPVPDHPMRHRWRRLRATTPTRQRSCATCARRGLPRVPINRKEPPVERLLRTKRQPIKRGTATLPEP